MNNNTFNRQYAKKMAEILNAFADGKTIERYDVRTEQWSDMTQSDQFYFSSVENYRVKKEPEYVPYDSVQEFQEAARKHGFWLGIVSTKDAYLPVNVDTDYVCIVQKDGDKFLWTYQDLLNKFVWADDGTPVGKLV